MFYIRRLPDQVTGPLVEVGTVFRPSWAGAVTAWGLLATAILLVGWVRLVRSPRRRLIGLVPLATLPLLLVWPFTEAGRFLVPLLPMILAGAVEGLTSLMTRLSVLYPPPLWGRVRVRGHSGGIRDAPSPHPSPARVEGVRSGNARAWAAAIVLALSIPYTAYATLTDRAGAQRRTQEPFDAACAWIARQEYPPGPVLTSHPAEVFWQTGRLAFAPAGDDPATIADLIRRHGAAYLVVDEDRYARAPTSLLAGFVARRPDLVRLVAGGGTSAAVYVVRDRDPR